MFHCFMFIIFVAFLWYFALSKIINVPRPIDAVSFLIMVITIAVVATIEPPSSLIQGAVTVIFFATFGFILARKINKEMGR